MSIEPIYTLEELAEKTGQPASFWVTECKAGRLGCIRPDPDSEAVLIMESDFQGWVESLRGEKGVPVAPLTDDEVPTEAYLTKAEQEALAPVP